MLIKKTWKKPGGFSPGLCEDILKQPHLLIAGATGSGKSVLINSIIYSLLYRSPEEVGLVLIDPKRVELVDFVDCPQLIRYASEPADIVETLGDCLRIMENRYKAMQKHHQKKSTSKAIYIIIDEFADLITTSKRETLPTLCRLAQLGRAANLHLIVATQRPTRDIVNGQIKVNLDCRVALRCPSPQDSRNIIDRKGAETLPRYGYGYYLRPEGLELVKIPLTDEKELRQRVEWWTNQTHRKPWKLKTA